MEKINQNKINIIDNKILEKKDLYYEDIDELLNEGQFINLSDSLIEEEKEIEFENNIFFVLKFCNK